ncbi:MAG: DUF6544 family protein [Woeseiaceae bacterium]|jgi:hypothetical protein|nr:DUF6544 family protein [Woeseiaceae bacterium]
MSTVILAIVATITLLLLALGAWQWSDRRAERAAWAGLVSQQPTTPASFEPLMVSGLPDPAQRFFRFSIAPGTPLYTVADIAMEGEFSLGTKAAPNYMPMRARQILAGPHGFIWRVRAGDKVWFSGSDGADETTSWSRFRLFGLVPVARAGDNDDHARSAFGRQISEAVFWTPAALLPGDGIEWQPVDDTTARVTVTHKGLVQAVDVTVSDDGRATKVVFQRWSDANPAKKYQLQPFGGYLSEYREFGGFRLPTRVEAGNHFETDDYFAFFKATITSVHFPSPGLGSE